MDLIKNLASCALVLASVAGCSNIGNAPAGASTDQVKAEEAAEPPLQQIRNLQFAPLPGNVKEERIKAIETKYHVSRDDAMKDLPPVHFSNQPPPDKPTGK